MTPNAAGRRAAVALAALLGALAVGGCGIRSTQVPVDAGPAPSRVPCEVSGGNITQAQPESGVPVRVYLVCASQLESVDRTAGVPEKKALSDRVQVAQALIDELQKEPSSSEREAGFATYVRGPIVAGGPRKGDPAGTLRLNRQPEDLPATALAQIVCTLAESRAAAPGGSVVLGGPGAYAPRSYSCSQAAKERPDETVPTLGALPSPSASQ
ncbi:MULTISPECIES: hypothetical protein [unclassified Streptomyces]|uniref:hypothetical protein n=1 Tax=unclassified Streptomyces TaxID=2593676 RepID=UPI0033340034